MKTTTKVYHCDRCKAEIPEEEVFGGHKIVLDIPGSDDTVDLTINWPRDQIHLCRDCVEYAFAKMANMADNSCLMEKCPNCGKDLRVTVGINNKVCCGKCLRPIAKTR